MNNKEKQKIYSRNYYLKNLNKFIKWRRRWKELNPEKVKESKRKQRKKYLQILQIKKEERRLYKLKHPHIYRGWKAIRLQILERDNFNCLNCGKKATEVHHKDGSGSNNPTKRQNNNSDNLISTCHKCNMLFDLELQNGSFNNREWHKKTERNLEIVSLVKYMSQTMVARKLNITRQRVSQIVKKFDKST